MSGDQHNELVFVFKLLAKNDIWSFILRFHSSILLDMKTEEKSLMIVVFKPCKP